MSKKLKVGIIGMGAIGEVHSNSYVATGEAKITAICDVDSDKLSAQGERLDVKHRFNDYSQLLAGDVEAVIVCVGNALHMEVAVAALEAGKHVFLEKPMALDASQAAKIQAAAERAGKVLQIGMVWRHGATSKVLREYVVAGLLGDIYHMRIALVRRRGIPGLGGWFTTKALAGGGPLIDLGVHWFDLSMWLAGLWNPTAVSAKTYAKFGPKMGEYKYVSMWAGPPKLDGVFDVEDAATGLVRFSDKATLSFDITWAANAEEQNSIEIMGDKGGARIVDGESLVIYGEHGGRLADITPQFDGTVNKFEGQAQSFISACRGECPPATTGQEGATIMKLLDAVYKSSETNKEVPITA